MKFVLFKSFKILKRVKRKLIVDSHRQMADAKRIPEICRTFGNSRYDKELQECVLFFHQIRKKRHSQHFEDPVDPVEMEIPDYPEIM